MSCTGQEMGGIAGGGGEGCSLGIKNQFDQAVYLGTERGELLKISPFELI